MVEPNDDAEEEAFRQRTANNKQLVMLLDDASRCIDETGGIRLDEF